MASLNKSGRSGRSKPASSAGDERSQDEFVDPSFDDVIVVDRSAERELERAGEPMRVCLACGEEEPSSDGACAHDEVAAFAAAPTTVIDAAERVRRAMSELVKAQRALSAIARSSVTSGEAVIDERVKVSEASAKSEPVECAVCAERAAFEARDHDRAKARRKRALNASGQAAFAFAVESKEPEPSESRDERAMERTDERASTGEFEAAPMEASANESIEPGASAAIESAAAVNEDAGASRGRRRRKSAA